MIARILVSLKGRLQCIFCRCNQGASIGFDRRWSCRLSWSHLHRGTSHLCRSGKLYSQQAQWNRGMYTLLAHEHYMVVHAISRKTPLASFSRYPQPSHNPLKQRYHHLLVERPKQQQKPEMIAGDQLKQKDLLVQMRLHSHEGNAAAPPSPHQAVAFPLKAAPVGKHPPPPLSWEAALLKLENVIASVNAIASLRVWGGD